MVLRMNQGVLRPDLAVAPSVMVNEVQNLKHASPYPHRMSGIDTRGETLIERRQTAPITTWMPQHQSLLARASLHGSLGNDLRQQS